MPFLPPNQQCQSTEGIIYITANAKIYIQPAILVYLYIYSFFNSHTQAHVLRHKCIEDFTEFMTAQQILTNFHTASKDQPLPVQQKSKESYKINIYKT